MYQCKMVAALLIVLLSSCCSNKNAAQETSPFSIELSSGGGFSGMHTGFIVKSTGALLYFSGMNAMKQEIRRVGEVTASDVAELRRLVEENKLTSFRHAEPGNMTTYLRITTGDELHTISWPGMDAEDTRVPAEALPLYRRIRELVDPLRGKALGTPSDE